MSSEPQLLVLTPLVSLSRHRPLSNSVCLIWFRLVSPEG